MKYIIVNNSTWDAYHSRMVDLTAQGFVFTYDYIEKLTDGGKTYPGGWGCMRFQDALPSNVFFTTPDTEYRYNDGLKLWVANGPAVLDQLQIEGLHQYFVGLEKNHQ